MLSHYTRQHIRFGRPASVPLPNSIATFTATNKRLLSRKENVSATEREMHIREQHKHIGVWTANMLICLSNPYHTATCRYNHNHKHNELSSGISFAYTLISNPTVGWNIGNLITKSVMNLLFIKVHKSNANDEPLYFPISPALFLISCSLFLSFALALSTALVFFCVALKRFLSFKFPRWVYATMKNWIVSVYWQRMKELQILESNGSHHKESLSCELNHNERHMTWERLNDNCASPMDGDFDGLIY